MLHIEALTIEYLHGKKIKSLYYRISGSRLQAPSQLREKIAVISPLKRYFFGEGVN